MAENSKPTKQVTMDVVEYFEKHTVPRRPSFGKVWKYVMDISRNGRKNNLFELSLNAVAREAEVSRRTAQQTVQVMVDEGILVREGDEPGEHGAFVYQVAAKQLVVEIPDPDAAPAKNNDPKIDAGPPDIAGDGNAEELIAEIEETVGLEAETETE